MHLVRCLAKLQLQRTAFGAVTDAVQQMTTVNVHEAKTQLSRLLARVAEGEEIVIAKAGRPVARLLPIGKGEGRRTPGSLRDRIVLDERFVDPLPDDELAPWNGQ